MPTIPVTSGTVEYTKEVSFTPNASVVPEAQTKPTMAATFALATAKVATIANVVKASVQALADVPLLRIWLDNRLMYSCSLKEEDTILLGDSANSIQGLMQLATPFAYTPLTSDNMMDVVARAAGSLQGKGFAVGGCGSPPSARTCFWAAATPGRSVGAKNIRLRLWAMPGFSE
jgi:HK97 family phage major capsid protein